MITSVIIKVTTLYKDNEAVIGFHGIEQATEKTKHK